MINKKSIKNIFENCIRLFFYLIKFQTENCYIIFFYVQVVHKGRDNTRFGHRYFLLLLLTISHL